MINNELIKYLFSSYFCPLISHFYWLAGADERNGSGVLFVRLLDDAVGIPKQSNLIKSNHPFVTIFIRNKT